MRSKTRRSTSDMAMFTIVSLDTVPVPHSYANIKQPVMESKDNSRDVNGSRIPSRRTQWLAAIAGFVAAVAFLGLSWMYSILASFLVFGAALSSWFPRVGRWLILVPAFLSSVIIVPVFVANASEMVHGVFVGPHDFNFVAMSLSWLLSPVLLIWCLGDITTTFVKLRRGSP